MVTLPGFYPTLHFGFLIACRSLHHPSPDKHALPPERAFCSTPPLCELPATAAHCDLHFDRSVYDQAGKLIELTNGFSLPLAASTRTALTRQKAALEPMENTKAMHCIREITTLAA